MPKKKNNNEEEGMVKTKDFDLLEEEGIFDEDGDIDPSIIEDTFADDFSEYNDVDDF